MARALNVKLSPFSLISKYYFYISASREWVVMIIVLQYLKILSKIL